MSCTFTWGFSLSTRAISQVFSACKLIPPSFSCHTTTTPTPNWQGISLQKGGRCGRGEKIHFSACFPAVSLIRSPTACLSVVHTHRHTQGAVPCGECLTYAIQLAGYFCLCEWAAVSLSKLWAQRRESCESQSLTSREIPSLYPTARWLISAE